MKKKITKILFTFILMFVSMGVVSAEKRCTCDTVRGTFTKGSATKVIIEGISNENCSNDNIEANFPEIWKNVQKYCSSNLFGTYVKTVNVSDCGTTLKSNGKLETSSGITFVNGGATFYNGVQLSPLECDCMAKKTDKETQPGLTRILIPYNPYGKPQENCNFSSFTPAQQQMILNKCESSGTNNEDTVFSSIANVLNKEALATLLLQGDGLIEIRSECTTYAIQDNGDVMDKSTGTICDLTEEGMLNDGVCKKAQQAIQMSAIVAPADCSDVADLVNEVAKIYNLLKIALVVLLVIFSLLDFVKATASPEDDQLSKAFKKLVTRAIIMAVIFMLPVLIQWILDIVKIEGLSDSCLTNL